MSKTPVVYSISWLNACIALGVLVFFAIVGYTWSGALGAFWGAMVYWMLSQLLRRFIPHHHRKAIGHCRRQEFEQAIPEFQKSIQFFLKYDWIDRFRAITMLSASGMGYREMALVSLGFCHAQIGDGPNARRHYEQCLQEFPDNGMARAALRLMQAGACLSSPDGNSPNVN